MPRGIDIINRTIIAIGEHIATEDALAGGDIGVGVDEAAYRRIIIPALQVIEAGILGVELATLTLCPTLGFHITKTRGFA